MKKIKLTQNKYALVDDNDYNSLSKFKWHFSQRYAARMSPKPNQRKIFMHHHILKPPTGKIIDHVNGNPLDNRKENLRICTTSENQHNQKVRKTSTSGFKGVHWHKRIKKWNAKLSLNNKDIHLGYFQIKREAAQAYNQAAIKYFGEFASLNEI